MEYWKPNIEEILYYWYNNIINEENRCHEGIIQCMVVMKPMTND